MGYFCSILLFIFICTASSEWAVDNGRNTAIECFEQIIHDGDISNLLIDVTTPKRIDDFCRRHAQLQKCTRENEHHMTVQENTEFLQKTSGVHSFYVNVCPPGTDLTVGYKGNAPCFRLIRDEILSCGSDLPDLNSYKMKNDLRFRCCSLKSHTECLKKVTAENCGNEASVVIEKIVQRYFDRKFKECNSTSHSCGGNGRTTVSDWTTHRRWNSHATKLDLPSTREYKYRTTERDDWKSTTAADRKVDWKSTTAADRRVDWKRITDADVWKKNHDNGGIGQSVNSAVSILSCFVAVLLLKL